MTAWIQVYRRTGHVQCVSTGLRSKKKPSTKAQHWKHGWIGLDAKFDYISTIRYAELQIFSSLVKQLERLPHFTLPLWHSKLQLRAANTKKRSEEKPDRQNCVRTHEQSHTPYKISFWYYVDIKKRLQCMKACIILSHHSGNNETQCSCKVYLRTPAL